MNRRDLQDSIITAQVFIATAKAALVDLDAQYVDYPERGKSRNDFFISGTRASGSCRRASLELTRKLADLRRSS